MDLERYPGVYLILLSVYQHYSFITVHYFSKGKSSYLMAYWEPLTTAISSQVAEKKEITNIFYCARLLNSLFSLLVGRLLAGQEACFAR